MTLRPASEITKNLLSQIFQIEQEIVELQQDIRPLLENPITNEQVNETINNLNIKYQFNSEEDFNDGLLQYTRFLEVEKDQLEKLQKLFQPTSTTNQQRHGAFFY